MIGHTKPYPVFIPISLFAILLFILVVLSPANTAEAIPGPAKICYVKSNAPGDNDGSSWSNAYRTIFGLKSALADNTCDQIWVAKGVYMPGATREDTFQLKNGLSLYGGFAGTEVSTIGRDIIANETYLSGNVDFLSQSTAGDSYHVVTGSGTNNTAILDGFTVTAGNASGSAPIRKGGGMYSDAGSPTVRNVTFKDNLADAGGGMYNNESTSEVTGVLFENNSGILGGGLYNAKSNVKLVNVTFTGNSAHNGGGIYNSYSNATLKNLTLRDNTAANYGGGLYNEWAKPAVTNVIFWGNTATNSGNQIYEDEGGVSNVTYSVVQGGFAAGSNIITDDPMLGKLGDHGGRMRVIPLNYNSSAIDEGNAGVCPYSDQRGFSRSNQGAKCDIGAYEYQPVFYVIPSGRTDGFCASWGFACDLQYALDSVGWAQEIWVRYGIYKPTGGDDRAATFQLPGASSVYGGFAGTETIRDKRDWQNNKSLLSGDIGARADERDNSYHVVTMKGSFIGIDTILDGFTISYGNANGSGDNSRGGGMFTGGANPILRNVSFTDNQAGSGGGLASVNRSSPLLQNVKFIGNSANQGGGMYSDQSNLTMNIVTFTGNKASQDGGGLFTQESTLEFYNVTFLKNEAGQNGGGMNSISGNDGSLTDITFDGNSAVADGGGLNSFFNNSFTLTGASFIGNEAKKGGGLADYDNTLALEKVTYTNNLATNRGGGIYLSTSSPTLSGVDFDGNRAVAGGGLYTYSGSPQLKNVTFTKNKAIEDVDHLLDADGGGMANYKGSKPKLTNVSFVQNSAFRTGGGMANFEGSNPVLEYVTFSANEAASGGGIYNIDSDPILTNITFAGNIAGAGAGGGIMSYHSDNMKLNYVTFSGNSSSSRGGAISLIRSETPEILNSIFWDNSAVSGGPQIYNEPLYSGWGLQQKRYSVVQDGCPKDMTCTNIVSTDPLLGALGDNGGQTQTIPLEDGSSAIDAADHNSATCPDSDQRGMYRPQGVYCDIGAYEARSFTLIVSKVGSGNGLVYGNGIYCGGLCRVDVVESTQVTLIADSSANAIFTGWGGACSGTGPCTFLMSEAKNVSASFDPVPPGKYNITVTLVGEGSGSVTGNGINCFDGPEAVCTKLFNEGDQVILTASAGPDSNFTGWTGSCTNGGGNCSVTMNGARTVTATFGSAAHKIYLPAVIK